MRKIIIALIIAAILFGCTAPVPGINDEAAMNEFKDVRAEYGMEEGFSANQLSMNAYLNKLSGMRGAIGFGEAGKVIGAEIDSATTFLYLIKAMNESNSLNFYELDCKDIRIKNTVTYAEAAMRSADDAETKIEMLSAGALENLRPNQLEAVKEYRNNAEQIKIAISEVC